MLKNKNKIIIMLKNKINEKKKKYIHSLLAHKKINISYKKARVLEVQTLKRL